MKTGNGEDRESVYTLYAHQKEAVARAKKHDAYALFMEPGCGKTIVGIDMIKHLRVAYPAMRTLVVCPLSCISSVWLSEIEKFAPELRAANLWKHLQDREPGLPKADVCVINYESLRRVDASLLAKFGFVILDESTRIKNHAAQVTKHVLKMRQYWRYRMIMSGLPAPNNLLEYQPQMAFINPAILGDNFYRFRAVNFFNLRNMPYLWRPTAEFKERLPKLLAQQAFVVKKADCLDLPDKTYQVRNCTLSKPQRKIYDQMLKANITVMKGKPVLAANELSKIMKLRQITSGFAVDVNGDAQEFSDDSKLSLLEEVLGELGEKQVIIWIQFIKEGEKIGQMLDSTGKAFGLLNGTISHNDKEAAIRKFLSGESQYLIAHPRTAGHGLTLVNCTYNVYYSQSYSLEERFQSEDRTHRIGQKESVTYIDLISEDTIDSVIAKSIKNKVSISQSILNLVKTMS